MLTVPDWTKKMRTASPPLMVSPVEPVPSMVMLWVIVGSAVSSMIVWPPVSEPAYVPRRIMTQ